VTTDLEARRAALRARLISDGLLLDQADRTPLDRWARPLAVGLTTVLLALFALELWYGWTAMGWSMAWGDDFQTVVDSAQRLFTGQPYYLDRQVHGPYPHGQTDVLYPPVTMFLFAPFIVVPFVVYVVIPIIVIGWLVYQWQPAPWSWPLMALCLVWPMTPLKTIAGNPSLYAALFVGLGLRYRWPGVFVLLKPSFGPLALIGIRDRGWWIGLGLLVLGSLPFIALTLQWPTVALDAQGTGLLYSLADLPMALIPILAWLGRRRQA
jgi:hypothetical protein